jgi:hypothetical protein
MALQKLISIHDPEQLGQVMRATRKWQRLNQDEVGRFSHSFIGEVESGKSTAQVGKVLEALQRLGIRVYLELPAAMPLQDATPLQAAMPSPPPVESRPPK